MSKAKRIRLGLVAGAVSILSVGSISCTAGATTTPRGTVKMTCSTPTPTSASGYNYLFNHLDPNYWGGADGGFSLKLPNGLVVWLFSDTMSYKNGFVHNSAIVQDKGCLHVSYNGRQLLPNDASNLIYWIDKVSLIPNTNYIAVRAQQVKIGTSGGWDFSQTGVYKTAKMHVTSYQNVYFDGWIKTEIDALPTQLAYTKTLMQNRVYKNGVAITYPDSAALATTDGSYSYNPQVHPWAKLSSGKLLLSVCYNNSNSLRDFSLYRPKFFEATP